MNHRINISEDKEIDKKSGKPPQKCKKTIFVELMINKGSWKWCKVLSITLNVTSSAVTHND